VSRGESEDYFPRLLKKKECKKPLDKRHKMCYNECVKGKQTTPPPRLEVNPKGGEENLKKLEKPLDKLNQVWYN